MNFSVKQKIIDSFSSIKVLVIGDIMLDIYMYGDVERISPEAPVPIFKFHHKYEMLGGAGNVVANLAALGCKTFFIGVVGQDDSGWKIASLLKKTKAKSHLLNLEGYSSIVKTRFIARNSHLLRMDNEEELPIVDSILERIKKVIVRAVKAVDVVLISDYQKGVLTDKTTPIIIDVCRELKKKVIVDPKGKDYEKYSGANIIKPNLQEFQDAVGKKYDPISQDFQQKISEAAQQLCWQYKIGDVIITLGEYGMIYVSGKKDNIRVEQIAAKVKEVYDVSGAGDTALAVLGASVGAGFSVTNAMKLANVAAGIVVSKLGTATVSVEELKQTIVDQGYSH
ncbi:D-glycero-beta-D-manno-heptose-7-phosphate kinase [Oxalobacter sp. OxGP1]|uniref:D-glycero-beta-D-manno-heptose-7-phosphate kinase n=1 Tax=Oxalobacter paeniformigenes TaxID=2946594 RepID=UPI0022AF0A19|nr:D-glycero-beta-D-manno-heptose-7-phosphate kinase [Oxalobacter paeniformigenes]MCZ4053265.1 D-glycero-beta-D-manno-heptose-7-phosphate kinase [Oxalobacter paeniformigenes]